MWEMFKLMCLIVQYSSNSNRGSHCQRVPRSDVWAEDPHPYWASSQRGQPSRSLRQTRRWVSLFASIKSSFLVSKVKSFNVVFNRMCNCPCHSLAHFSAPLMVIVEYCKHGNLSSYLKSKRGDYSPYKVNSIYNVHILNICTIFAPIPCTLLTHQANILTILCNPLMWSQLIQKPHVRPWETAKELSGLCVVQG